MKNKKKLVGLIILLIIGLFVLRRCTNDSQARISVRVSPVQMGELTASVSAVGQVSSVRENIIQAKTGGIIENVLVKEGDDVAAGQEIIELDSLTGTIFIRSPISGRVIHQPKHTKAGVSVNLGQELLTIADLNDLAVEANVNEVDVGEVKTGQKVKISSDAFAKEEYWGEVISVAPQVRKIDGAAKVPVKIKITSSSPLRPGNRVDTEIITAHRQATILVPLEAVISRDNEKCVYVAENGLAKKHRVETGINSLDNIEVVSANPIKPGDQVIVTNNSELRDGAKIKVVEYDEQQQQ
ncbi:efflux RND transporter periplasmic adaptor subunit [Candidatus Margulisiibacteriota bacterium]